MLINHKKLVVDTRHLGLVNGGGGDGTIQTPSYTAHRCAA